MEDKKLTFTTQLDAKASPGMERAIKKYGKMVQDASNMEGMFKSMDKWIKKDKELAKTFREHSNKALKEKNQLLEDINKRVEKSTKLYRDAEKYADQWLNKSKARLESRYGAVPGFAQQGLQQRRDAIAGRIRGTAYQDMMEGSAVLNQMGPPGGGWNSAAAQQRLMQMGYLFGAAGTAANIYSDYLTTDLNKLRNQATVAGFAGDLYSQITEGNYSGVRALARLGGPQASMFGGQSAASVKWGQIGQGLSGIGQIAGGASLILGGGPFAVAGAGVALSGAGTIARAIKGVNTDEGKAAEVNAIRSAAQWYDDLDPISKRNFEKFAGSARFMGDLGNMAGGKGTAAWKQIQQAVVGGGMTVDEAMPFYMQLRSGVGQAGAENLIGGVSGSLRRFGIDRNTATGALMALSGQQGGSAQAERKLEDILARAFRAGLTDSGTRSMLLSNMAGALSGVGGRAGNVGAMAELVAGQASAFGGEAAGMNIAAGGLALQGGLFGTGGPIRALATAQAGNIASVAGKYGLSMAATQALVTIGNPAELASATPDSPIWKALKADGKSDTEIRAIFSEIRGGAFATTSAFMGSNLMKNPYARDIIMAGAMGGTAETQAAAWGIGGGVLKGGAGSFTIEGQNREQDVLNAYQNVDAFNKMIPFLEALKDGNAAENLGKLALAGTEFAATLNQISTISPDALRDVPDLLDKLTRAVGRLGVVLGALPNLEPQQPMTPVTAQPPAPGMPIGGRRPTGRLSFPARP